VWVSAVVITISASLAGSIGLYSTLWLRSELAFTCCGQIVEPLDQLRKNIAFGHGFLGSQGALSLPALVVAQVIEFVFAIQAEDPWLRTAVLPLRRSSEGAARRSSDLLL
jgi:hypothetical protein